MKWLLPIILICAACNSTKTVHTTNDMVDNTIQGDQASLNYIQPYKDSLDSYMNEVIGEIAVDMEWKRDQLETIQGNFVADLCYDFALMASKLDTFGIGTPDMVLLNFGGLRTSLYKGPITRGKVYELMPFENNLVAIKLNPERMTELIDYIGESGGQPVSNAQFTIENKKTASYNINGEQLKVRDYWVITSDYLGNGGDKMNFFKDLPQISLGKLRDIIMSHIENSREPLSSKIDGRIINGK